MLVICVGPASVFAEKEDGASDRVIVVHVTEHMITMDGEVLASVSDGSVARKHIKRGAARRLIEPLQETVAARVAELEKSEPSGDPIVRIIADSTVTARLIEEVMSSCREAAVTRLQLGLFEMNSKGGRVRPDDNAFVAVKAPTNAHWRTRRPKRSGQTVMQAFAGASKSAKKQEREEEKRLLLKLELTAKGIDVVTSGKTMKPMDECPEKGATICLRKPGSDTVAATGRARAAYMKADVGTAAKHRKEVLVAYDFRRLHNKLTSIKKEYPKDTVIDLVVDKDLPALLIKAVAERVRHRLPKASYSDADAYEKAVEKEGAKAGKKLFPNVFVSSK
jgi:hypothetical protein